MQDIEEILTIAQEIYTTKLPVVGLRCPVGKHISIELCRAMNGHHGRDDAKALQVEPVL
jgi:hypothetical protein